MENKSAAIEIFDILVGMGYACSIKHIGGKYAIEVPVTLRGDPAYGQQAAVMDIATRGGLFPVQAGEILRIS